MLKAFYIIPFFFISTLFAQVPNSSFENWTNNVPTGWETINIPIVPQGIIQDTNAYMGNYCVRGVVETNSFNQPFAPYLGYSGPSAQGFTIILPFARLEGYCKLNLKDGDFFDGTVHIYNSNHEPIGKGHLILSGVIPQWQHFTIDITYDSIDVSMACALFFTITDSSGLASGHAGSTFWIDYLSMTGVASAGVIDQSSEPVFNFYPNPASDYIHVHISNATIQNHLTISDVEGRIVKSNEIFSDELIAVNDLKAGIYFVNVYSNEKNFSEKLLITEK
jgi:hypothetical protein